MIQAAASYREFPPRRELRTYVRALFTFSVPAAMDVTRRPLAREVLFGPGEEYSSALFADGHVSLAFSFGPGYRVEGLWEPRRSGPHGHVIGAIPSARRATHGNSLVQVGAYFHAGHSNLFLPALARELTGRILPLADLWGAAASAWEVRLA